MSLLPPEAYWSEGWLEVERQRIFADSWVLAGSIDELQAPGDYVTVDAGQAPLLVVRADDGVLRAFHNFCRHRGMALVEGRGNVGPQLTCVYHAWRYGLDGALRVIPQRRDQFPDVDSADWGLVAGAVDTWAGMVFAHPTAAVAGSFTATLDGMQDALGSYRPERLSEVATATFDLACNWKLFVENHVDVYHLWYLHERSLGGYDHTRFEHRAMGPHWTSWEPRRACDVSTTDLSQGTVEIAHLDDHDLHGLGAHLVFPNVMIAAAAEFFATYVAEPVSAERTRLHLRVRAEPGADGDALLKAVGSFIEEDIVACEAVQRAVRSPLFSVGPLARDHEAPIVAFHRNLLARLEP
ncbi:MAG TPA: aromatic ring-hydroxylating dioxygenase subunit alpha [Acidimicrobiales bacterium]|nr:aromatic ring-hydroxylating dioxygenase subunit alpha [Acidimicrobiales bacterium]